MTILTIRGLDASKMRTSQVAALIRTLDTHNDQIKQLHVAMHKNANAVNAAALAASTAIEAAQNAIEIASQSSQVSMAFANRLGLRTDPHGYDPAEMTPGPPVQTVRQPTYAVDSTRRMSDTQELQPVASKPSK